jgi:hypothetical protein
MVLVFMEASIAHCAGERKSRNPRRPGLVCWWMEAAAPAVFLSDALGHALARAWRVLLSYGVRLDDIAARRSGLQLRADVNLMLDERAEQANQLIEVRTFRAPRLQFRAAHTQRGCATRVAPLSWRPPVSVSSSACLFFLDGRGVPPLAQVGMTYCTPVRLGVGS